ncbi:hypothetical protein Pfo_012244 [Paulownia fortunei]|nr:hypothetical protein Pfo_012244 [Paulownia fortunei]
MVDTEWQNMLCWNKTARTWAEIAYGFVPHSHFIIICSGGTLLQFLKSRFSRVGKFSSGHVNLPWRIMVTQRSLSLAW